MITVIIAGGSGTRLWPLSTPDYPKHLLALNGDGSLGQNTYARAKKVGREVYVSTEASHAHHVQQQLPDLPKDHFIIEPARRGTASCIVAALEHIAGQRDNDEPIAFIAADHYIRDMKGFAHSFKVAEQVSKQEGRIVLVGAEPDYPATGFGYIQKGEEFDDNRFVYCVKSFKEKPDFAVAREYLKSGNYLWNCSYFVASINTFLREMELHAPKMLADYNQLKAAKNKDEYAKAYLDFENISIDYALIEKVDDLLVVPASFDWADLGSFNDLHKVVDRDQNNNHVNGENVELEGVDNSYVHNTEDKPVAVIGLDNVAVINTPNGILVTRKDLAQKVGDVSKRFNKDKK